MLLSAVKFNGNLNLVIYDLCFIEKVQKKFKITLYKFVLHFIYSQFLSNVCSNLYQMVPF